MCFGIVKSELRFLTLSWDLIRDCNLDMRLDSIVGVFAITSLRALFAVLGVQLFPLLQVHMPLPAFSFVECVSWCFVPSLPVR